MPAAPVALKIGYIGGGSRGWAHGLMKDLALCPWFTGEVRLYDIDYEAARLNERIGARIQSLPGTQSRWRYRAVRTLKEALAGADFVFLSIQPGPIEFMKHDLELPMKYGVYQPVGDTTGPGGLVRGLRSARIYKGFAEAVATHCPRAWVINFTNPMAICTRTLHEVFPAIKAFGCCHEVFGTQHMLGRLYAGEHGVPRPPRTDITVNVLGVNHFTWIDRAHYKGEDLLALVRTRLARPGALRFYTKAGLLKESSSVFHSMGRVTNELFHRFGILAAAGDRHLAEFVPWFLTSRTSCYRWGFRLTPYSYRIGRWRSAPRLFRRQLAGAEPIVLQRSDEEYMNQMAALAGLCTLRTNVNLPNRGQMGGIPLGPVVETNAVFSRDTVEPVVSGSLPEAVNALVHPHTVNQTLIVQGALEGDKDKAFAAFVIDPLNHRLPVDGAWKLFNEMLRATRFSFD
ncbi:alpha-glucosidase/alpha-galactosidase [bacterium]|nr:alpha-glucosidase/alpha-galactosidase [bacterium]